MPTALDTSPMEAAGSALSTGLDSMVSSMGGTLGGIAVKALPLLGIGLIVSIGYALFKRMASKAGN